MTMKKYVHISEQGDDNNDGLTPETPVYSWRRAVKVHGGKNNFDMKFLDESSEVRCKREVATNKQ
jgi:hypothetical protein